MNITNADLEVNKEYQAALECLIKKHRLAIEELTERQFVEALRQALACGDFQRLVVTTGEHAQQVIYIPFSEQARLQARIRELEGEVEILRDYDDPRD